MTPVAEVVIKPQPETHVQDAPSGPRQVGSRRRVANGSGGIAAFVFELDALFDGAAFDTARARAAVRRLATDAGVDSMWLEVEAVETMRGGEHAAAQLAQRLLPHAPTGTFECDKVVARDGAEEVLSAIHQRFKLALISQRSRHATERILRVLGLERAFDAIACRTSDGDAEDADMWHLCLEALEGLGEAPSECVLVGCLGSRSLGAAAFAGMQPVAVSAPGAACATTPGDGGPLAGLVVDDLRLVEGLAAGASAKYLPPAPSSDDEDDLWYH